MVGMVLAVADATGTPAQGNIEQRIFDKFPAHPAAIAIHALYDALPYFDRVSIQNALRRMMRDGAIVRAVEHRFSYRRAGADTPRPKDARGRPPRAG